MADESVWEEVDGALQRTVKLGSFAEAIQAVNRIAELAERENHHPDLLVSYRTVTVRWTSHSEGGITDRDRAMAAATDPLLGS